MSLISCGAVKHILMAACMYLVVGVKASHNGMHFVGQSETVYELLGLLAQEYIIFFYVNRLKGLKYIYIHYIIELRGQISRVHATRFEMVRCCMYVSHCSVQP